MAPNPSNAPNPPPLFFSISFLGGNFILSNSFASLSIYFKKDLKSFSLSNFKFFIEACGDFNFSDMDFTGELLNSISQIPNLFHLMISHIP